MTTSNSDIAILIYRLIDGMTFIGKNSAVNQILLKAYLHWCLEIDI
jgi:hypothetical protein